MSVSKPGNPNDLTEVTTSDPGNPTSLTGIANQVLPRSIQPYINFDFANNVYEVNNEGTSLTDAVTYSRASSATFVDRYIDQNNQYQYFLNTDFVGTVTNKVLYSEDFSNSEWALTRATLSSNKVADQNGQPKMVALVDNGDSGTHAIAMTNAATVTSGATVTFSIDAKAINFRYILLFCDQTSEGNYFDLINGDISNPFSTAPIPAMRYLGNGVYRCSITTTVPGTAATFGIYADTNAASPATYTGNTEAVFAINRAQLTESVKAEPYVQTFNVSASKTFSATPRLEYDPATGESLGYLSERAGTNLMFHSEDFTQSAWNDTEAIVTPNDAIAPDLTKSADKFIATNVNANHLLFQGASVVSGQSYTQSIYAKASEYAFLQLTFGTGGFGGSQYANFDLNNGVLGTVTGGSAKIENVGNNWYRCSFTATATATTSTSACIPILIQSATDSRSPSFTGDNTSGLYIWGAQTEGDTDPASPVVNYPYSTSYMRTGSALASRSGDNMWILVAQPTEVTMFVEANYLGSSNSINNGSRFLEYNDNTATSRIIFYNNNGRFSGYFVQAVGVVQASDFGGSIVTDNSFNKAAFAFKTNYFRLYENGVLVSSDDAGIIPTVDELDIAHTRFVNQLDGHLKKARIYNLILTDDEVSRL